MLKPVRESLQICGPSETLEFTLFREPIFLSFKGMPHCQMVDHHEILEVYLERRALTVVNFRTLAIAVAVLSGVVFAMPTSSQAMPPVVPVKIDAASNGSLVQIYYRRYCRYGRCYAQYRRYGYREYRRSYYDNCQPYDGYYGADRPCCYRPCYGYYQPQASSYRRAYGYPSFYRYYERPCF
jgi:hypothetical protein